MRGEPDRSRPEQHVLELVEQPLQHFGYELLEQQLELDGEQQFLEQLELQLVDLIELLGGTSMKKGPRS